MAYSYARCCLVIDDIRRLIEQYALTTSDLPRAMVVDVVDAVRDAGITRSAFTELDDRPGRFDPQYRKHLWHMVLRILRNDLTSEVLDVLVKEG
jgi:hypothetical protein